MVHKVCFGSNSCEVTCLKLNESKLIGNRIEIVYIVYLDLPSSNIENCLVASITQNTWLWNNMLGHASKSVLAKLSKNDLVKGLPKLRSVIDHICNACMKGK